MMIDNIMDGLPYEQEITEGFMFNGFDTRENDMFLVTRSAPTPSSKDIVENLPFVHGVYDFSNILGERIFENRALSYVFQVYEEDYEHRKHNQTELENKLMSANIQMLEDTHGSNYYYLGKCVSVSVEDDHQFGKLIINIEFDCYPFKISKLPEGHDIWDEFNFILDVAQEIRHTVDGTKEITLYNLGTPSVVPTITVSSEMTIEKGALSVTVPSGTSKSELIRLQSGENRITIKGNGTIEFDFYKELI